MPLKTNKQRWFLMLSFLAVWFLLVLYPNPGHLTASVYRLINPPVAPAQISEIALGLADRSPCEIKVFVYTEMPYRHDWEVYGMPWYFPTLGEALRNRTGDCKSRYLLFASLMEELEIPYEKRVSFTHIWLHYEGKPDNALENEGEMLFVVDEEGRLKLSMPRPDLQRAMTSIYRGFWETMPGEKKILLLAGFPAVFSLSAMTRPSPRTRPVPSTDFKPDRR